MRYRPGVRADPPWPRKSGAMTLHVGTTAGSSGKWSRHARPTPCRQRSGGPFGGPTAMRKMASGNSTSFSRNHGPGPCENKSEGSPVVLRSLTSSTPECLVVGRDSCCYAIAEKYFRQVPGSLERGALLSSATGFDEGTHMMKRLMRLATIWILAAITVNARAADETKPRTTTEEAADAVATRLFARDNLVAWCIVPFDSKKRGPIERVAMLRRLGFRHYAYDWRDEHLPTFDTEVAELQKNGIELTAIWFPGLDASG